MYSLTELVEYWNDIYCRACDPDARPPGPQPSTDSSPAANTPPRWSSAPTDAPLIFLIKGRRWPYAPQGADMPPLALPTWDAERALAALNVTEEPFDATNGDLRGYARGRMIAVSPINLMPHKTRFHELAHVLLGHTAEGYPLGDERTPPNLAECEAEAVAMLCCAALDLPGVELAGRYIQHWWGPGKIPKRSAQRILEAVDQILKAGIPPPADDLDRS